MNENDKQAEPVQEPDYWLGYGLQAHTNKPFEGATELFTKPVQAQPVQPAECENGCPKNQVCDYCQGTAGTDKPPAAINEQMLEALKGAVQAMKMYNLLYGVPKFSATVAKGEAAILAADAEKAKGGGDEV